MRTDRAAVELSTADIFAARTSVRYFEDRPVAGADLAVLEAACARHGHHGRRLLLVRAGAAARAVWLTAIGGDLYGSVFAGALPGPLRELAGVDGARRLQLFACAVGHPRA